MRVTHLLMLALPLVALAADPCNVHGDCQSCVSGHLCGWCSTNVVYKNGDPGAHCASNDGTHPFACYGIFSTEDCIRGYVCNTTLHICTLGNPGEGLPYTDCISACGSGPVPPQPPTPGPGPAPPQPPPAETYLCNSSDWTCFQTTPGHGTSKDVCTQSCHAPTPSMPAPPPPPMAPTPPAQTYLCNTTAYTCDVTIPGHGTSKEVCVQQCTKPPAPTPLQGTWRGIQIDNQYKYGEYVLTLDKGFTMTHDGQPFAQGSMYAGSSPGTLKISFSQGWNAGKDFLGLYTESQGVSVMHLTLVMGSGPTDQPSGWDKPWIAGGPAGTEFVFMKVNAA
eukprot:TRINITY_DN361_c0_g2_i1.p1 TRINITY_DN361_c0_g2~~TRINITY_DN361_c0_g2_i1.p1  ORF type:complete len:335 (+),score=46.01 TRINITY_DN361_c0_g2_i1:41-1045(+)